MNKENSFKAVRPLEWTKVANTSYEKHFKAEPFPGYRYDIKLWSSEDPDDAFWGWYLEMPGERHNTPAIPGGEEAAKNACESDWRYRISAALLPDFTP